MTDNNLTIITDEEKLEYWENKYKKATMDFFSKTINGEQYIKKSTKYYACIEHYRKKLNKPDFFANNEEVDYDIGDELIQRIK